MNYAKIHDLIIDRARQRKYDKSIHHKHHVIPLHEDSSSEDLVPLTVKEHWIIHRLRWKMTGTLGNKLAYLLLKGSGDDCERTKLIQSEAGKVGGYITKKNKNGIFDPDYDRSKTSKELWENGTIGFKNYTYEQRKEAGQKGGSTTKENNSGIFREDLQHKRSEWAKLGAQALDDAGTRGGYATKKWIEDNPEKQKKNASDGGKKGGKKVGSMYWWNDGTHNKKSFECPGDGWVRGMLMSEKKRKQVYEKIAGHNRKDQK